jgi:HK97 family phage major capsid protein/HK97 family phage prohead protease
VKQKFAYSMLTIKSVDEEAREITGMATTPSADRTGDIVDPEGADYTLPIPLLWQHDSRQPVGHVVEAKVTKAGIWIRAKFVKIAEPGGLQERLDTAWQSVKSGLVQGLSIGFKDIEAARIADTWSYRYLKWLWLELSCVTIPANGDCTVETVKSLDQQQRSAVSGALPVVRLKASLPGVTGKPTPVTPKGTDMKISEQLLAFDTRKKEALAKMTAIMEKAAEESRSLDEKEAEEYKDLKAEAAAADEHIARLKEHEAFMVSKAAVVDTGANGVNANGGAVTLPGAVISVRRNIAPGTAFTRYAASLAVAKGGLVDAMEFSKKFKDTPEVELVLRSAVAAGTTSDATWAGPLVQYQDMISEFIGLLRPRTILGRLDKVRRVPFNVRMHRQTAGVTGSFVGEGLPTPVNKLAFDNVTLPWAKASCIVVLTNELVRLANPSAEALVREDLLAGISAYLDKRFIDPSYAGVANVSPASITNGVTPVNSSGVTLAAVTLDAESALDKFDQAEIDLSAGAWVMARKTARRLSMFRNAYDQFAFPTLRPDGGTFFGYDAVVSNAVASSGSPTDRQVVLLDQNEIFLADDGDMMLDASSEASVQMNDAPSAGAQSLVSLWQNGMTGLKVDRWIYWTKRRAEAAQIIDNVNW